MNELELLGEWKRQRTRTNDDAHARASARAALDAAIGDAVGGEELGVVTAVQPARRRLVGRALVAATVTTVFAVGGVLFARGQVHDRMGAIRRVALPKGSLHESTVPFPMTILVVGTDSRAFVENATQEGAFGSAAHQGTQRADVMMLVRLTASSTTVVSLPRDLVFSDGGGSPRQLNSYFDDGPQELIDALRSHLRIEVDHYVQVNFSAFIKVVDKLGGVRLMVPGPVRDLYSGLDIAAPGCRTLDGNNALAWVRSRHLELRDSAGKWTDESGQGDLGRITRQQEFLMALLARTRRDVGSDLGKARDVADSIVRSLTVDSRFTSDQILSLASRFVRDDPSTWMFLTAPVQPSQNDPNRFELVGPAGEDLFTPHRDLLPDFGAERVPSGMESTPNSSGGSSC